MLKEISLAGKTALVTGGATGIGFAIAEEMIDAGADVVIVGRREDKLLEAKEKLGEKCTCYRFDVSEFDKHAEFIKMLEEKAPIDILVNCAGVNNKKDYLDFTPAEFETLMKTQAEAPFFLSQEVAKYMKERHKGCIILISSLSAILGMHQIQAYTVAKTGMTGLARSLARDLGPYGIRVNSLNPGFVYTDMLRNTNLKTPERLVQIQEATPLKGFTMTKDLGMAAAFLASDAARFVNAHDLVVDGGISQVFNI